MDANRFAVLALGAVSVATLSGWNQSVAAERSTLDATKTREVCTEEVVERKKPAKDDDRVVGTVAGALVGGIVGDKVGGDIATVGGAVAGGYAGNQVQKKAQKDKTEKVTRLVCRPVSDRGGR